MDRYYEERIAAYVESGHNSYDAIMKHFPDLEANDIILTTKGFAPFGEDDNTVLELISPKGLEKGSFNGFKPNFRFKLTSHGYALLREYERSNNVYLMSKTAIVISIISVLIALTSLLRTW